MDKDNNKINNLKISYEELMNLEDSELFKELQDINIKENNIIMDCISNILNNNTNIKNYLMFIKLDNFYHFKKDLFEKNKIEELYNNFKNILLKYKEEQKNKKDKNNNNNQEIQSDIFKDFSNSEINKILFQFLKILFKIYDNEKELNDFFIENKDFLGLYNKNKFLEFYKEIDEYFNSLNLLEKIIKELEDNKNQFSKEEIEFYELLLMLYFKKQNIDYKENIPHLDKFLSIFTFQNNEEVINEMINFLFNLFDSNNIKYLFKKCKDNLDNSNIIKLYKYVIEQLEKDYMFQIKPHYLLCKKNIIPIKIVNNENEKILNFYGNTTINEINNFLIKNYESQNEYYIVNLNINEKEKGNITFDDSYSNKTLNELKKNKIEIIKKEIIQNLFENEKLTENFKNILIKWFKYFSKGNNEMNREQLAECFNKLSGKKNELFTGRSIRIISFLKKYSDNNIHQINIDKFIDFYSNIFINNNEKEKQNLIKNLKNMNLRSNLTKIPQEIKNELLPRYYLSNKIEENNDLYLFDILKEKYKNSLNEELFDFISFLSTNEEIYNNVLNNFNSDENQNFTQKYDEYIHNLYILMIIESIFEDVEIFNNNKIKEIEISLKEYKPFFSLENNDIKKKFFIDFFDKRYSDLIEYASKILEKMNMEGKKDYLIIRCCSKCLEIINNIYYCYYNIKYENIKKENIENIEYKSIRNIIEENNLDKNIRDSSIYKNIINQLLIFIDKYYNKIDINNDKEQNLMKNCYLLLFSLLYMNNEIFNYIIENNKNLLDKIINSILIIENNKKNIYYIRILFISIIRQKEIKINNNFLSYLADLFFKILEENLKGKKIKFEGIHSIYLNSLITYNAENAENLNNNLKNNIIKIYEYLYNYISSKNLEKNINEVMLISIIENITKSLEKCSFTNDIINEKYNNEMTLYDLCMNKFFEIEEKKIIKKNKKYSQIEGVLNDDTNNKFISEEKLNENINKIINDNNNSDIIKENVIKEMISYCNLCLSSQNKNIKEYLIKIILNLIKLKEKEEEEENDINLNNSQDSSDSSNDKKIKLKNLKKKRRKKISEYVGIRNLGSFCYLNSIIQFLYMIPQFKYSIMSVNDNKDSIKSEFLEDDNLLHQLQRLFTYLSYTSYGEVIPKNLILSVKDLEGNPISPGMQDSNEFFLNFSDKIEESLKNTKYEYLINNLFVGKICNKKTCNSCKNTSYTFEEFKYITLEVNGITKLNESLDKYILDEKIENYDCSYCKQKVILNKSNLISNLPNILIFHLNRLVIDMKDAKFKKKKINSKFDFPMKLNIKKYCIENNVEETDNIYLKKDEYYEYELKGVNIHKGNADAGHYISIIKLNNDKWYQFDDSRVNEFDLKNFEEKCFGGISPETKEERKENAYLLFYELSKKKPLKISIKENEIDKENNKENIVEYNDNNMEEIKKKYDNTKLNNSFDEKELMNKIFHNTEKNNYFKYISYDDIQREVHKEYFLEVLKDNKLYEYLYGNKIINYNNYLIQLITKIIEGKNFNIKEKNISFDDYKKLVNIFMELIISYISDDNNRNNPNKENIQNINNIITKIFLPLFENENPLFNNSLREMLFNLIEKNLFSSQNIKLIFLEPIKEISERIYEVLLSLIKINEKEKNLKLQKSISKIINDGNNISLYLYKIFFELIKKNSDNYIDDDTKETFMILFYKLNSEEDENLKEVTKILTFFIVKREILKKRDDIIQEIKFSFKNCVIIKNLFQYFINTLILLTQKYQYNDEDFSRTFNSNEIQKLYTYCLKGKDKNEIKERQIKLLKFIIEILQINDKYTPNRIEFLMGYPTLVIKKDKEKNISLFGVSLMNNDIKTEIFKYTSYNHIKKERCLLAFLFPSSYEQNEENQLDENDRNDLIYKLISNSLGINSKKKGNYFLFKYIYLMQSRNIIYDNLYQEIKNILENANKKNNNKYDLLKFKSEESECIRLIEYETGVANHHIRISKSKDPSIEKDKKFRTKPKLSSIFISSQTLIEEKVNKNFIGFISNIIPHEIGKIQIMPVATSQNLSIFRFEYFTTYFTKKEIKNLSEEKKEFIYSFIKRDKPSENENNIENDDENLVVDFSTLIEKNNEKDFMIYIDDILKNKKEIIIVNKDIINEKKLKSTLIRYYLLNKTKKTVFQIKINKSNDIEKDMENNYYLPNQLYDFVEENHVKNIINVYRIKYDYNFLKSESIGINIKISNAEKYFKEFLE